MSGDLKKRVIVQETFDDIVKENIEDLEMDPEEAIADAIESLEAQVRNKYIPWAVGN